MIAKKEQQKIAKQVSQTNKNPATDQVANKPPEPKKKPNTTGQDQMSEFERQ